MRFDDINAAMERARYEIIEDDEPYYAEIPEVKGVWATGKTLEECRQNLAAALKLWHLFSVQIAHRIPPFGAAWRRT